MSRPRSSYVPRVVQLDAVDLDNEVIRILKDQLLNVFKFTGNSFLSTWEPELEFLLKTLVWKFSVIKSDATFGHQMLGLKYGGKYSKNKAWLFALITFGTTYLQSRSVEIACLADSREKKDLVHKIFRHLEAGIQLLTLVNFVIFLRKGIYPTLAYRILGFTVVPLDPSARRNIGYSYMMRELLWHGFIELLGFTLPLINYHYLKRRIGRLFFAKDRIKSINAHFSENTLCSLCAEPPVLPHQIGCAHIFCYYCIKSQILADPQFECNVCGFIVQDSIEPVKM